ncbi:MAG: response regulator [Deltaproteobacteria bacterium]|nr:response regulator [Deltaproteobacteria bacterium]
MTPQSEASRPILLIDDESAHRRIFKRALKKAGISRPVLECSSLGEAKALVKRIAAGEAHAPVVAFLDLNLGDGRGTALISALRSAVPTSGIPILILSTSSLERDVEESLSLGATRYLLKLDDPEQFCARIIEELHTLFTPTNKPLND